MSNTKITTKDNEAKTKLQARKEEWRKAWGNLPSLYLLDSILFCFTLLVSVVSFFLGKKLATLFIAIVNPCRRETEIGREIERAAGKCKCTCWAASSHINTRISFLHHFLWSRNVLFLASLSAIVAYMIIIVRCHYSRDLYFTRRFLHDICMHLCIMHTLY